RFKLLEGLPCPHSGAERMRSEDGKYGWCDLCFSRSPITPVYNGIIERLDRQNGSIAKLQEASNRLESEIVALRKSQSTRRVFWLGVASSLTVVAVDKFF